MKEGFKRVLQITITGEILHYGRNLSANDFRKEGLRKRIICKASLPDLHIQTSFRRANFFMVTPVLFYEMGDCKT